MIRVFLFSFLPASEYVYLLYKSAVNHGSNKIDLTATHFDWSLRAVSISMFHHIGFAPEYQMSDAVFGALCHYCDTLQYFSGAKEDEQRPTTYSALTAFISTPFTLSPAQ